MDVLATVRPQIPADLHMGSGGNFSCGQMCMGRGKLRTPESTPSSGPNTYRVQLPSIKLESPAMAVPDAKSQPALICTSLEREGRGAQGLRGLLEKKKYIVYPIKINKDF